MCLHIFKVPECPIYVLFVHKMSVPKLSFREPPLRIKVRRVQVNPRPADIESQEPEVPKTNKKVLYFFGIVILLMLFLTLRSYFHKNKVHTIKKLKCEQHNRILSCFGTEPEGTFVVQIPDSCSGSVYDIGGYPFSVASQGKYYKVPADKLTVRSVNGKCDIKAFIDSNEMNLYHPFTWITTNQHTIFTIMDGDDIIVDKGSASLFESVAKGSWIAYTYDIPGLTANVIGDGTDIIHIYNGVYE